MTAPLASDLSGRGDREPNDTEGSSRDDAEGGSHPDTEGGSRDDTERGSHPDTEGGSRDDTEGSSGDGERDTEGSDRDPSGGLTTSSTRPFKAEKKIQPRVKRSTGHTHTHTDREQHPDTDTHTHTRTTRTTPQTNTPHKHLTTLEGGATTVRATFQSRVNPRGGEFSSEPDGCAPKIDHDGLAFTRDCHYQHYMAYIVHILQESGVGGI